jgi:ABC-type lipoprotein release transport system permease subunit
MFRPLFVFIGTRYTRAKRRNPRLFGFPRFYWLQLSFIVLGVVCTTIVYRMTRRTTGRKP